jgi:hypothetical protein
MTLSLVSSLSLSSPNSAPEQAASAARPWQTAQGKTPARGGPRPVPRPPLLTASVSPPMSGVSSDGRKMTGEP